MSTYDDYEVMNEMPVDFDGITITLEEKETLEANNINNLADLCKQTFKKIGVLLGNKATRAIQDQLISKKGLDFTNTRRSSLKTAC